MQKLYVHLMPCFHLLLYLETALAASTRDQNRSMPFMQFQNMP